MTHPQPRKVYDKRLELFQQFYDIRQASLKVMETLLAEGRPPTSEEVRAERLRLAAIELLTDEQKRLSSRVQDSTYESDDDDDDSDE